MSFLGPNVATMAQIAAATISTTIFSAATSVSGRNIYNSSTAVCYVAYGTVASTTAYAYQIPANSNSAFAVPTYSGPVSAIWTAVNGSALTSQW